MGWSTTGSRLASAMLAATILWAMAVANAGAGVYGVNAHVPPPELLDELAAAGVTWARIDFRWSYVEPEPDRFEWATYDALVDAALARGLRLFATISDTPAWATHGPAGRGVPSDAADWYDVCYRAASRYRGRIDHWGMWNEPNTEVSWAGSRSAYVEVLLKPGAQAIHAANPAAKVCAPELAHLESTGWDTWLEDVIKRAGAHVDVVTHHVYPDRGSWRSVIDRLTNDGRYPWEPPSVRKVLQRAGWFGRPFWLTETGVAAGGPEGEEMQRSFVTGLLPALFGPGRMVSWVHAAFFYEASDDPSAADAFGLLGPAPEYRRKPSFDELGRLVVELEVDDAEVVRVQLPDWLPAGASAHGAVVVRNTGTTTWSAAGGYRLAALGDDDRLAAIRHDLEPGEEVPPGAERAFLLELAAPLAVGAAGERIASDWQMIREARWRFGEVALGEVGVGGDPQAGDGYAPLVAGLADASGNAWESEVVLHNRGTVTRSASITLLSSGADNAFARALSYAVAPGTSTVLADVVVGEFGARGRGALRVAVDSEELLVGVTTTVRGGAGAHAEFTPALTTASAIPGGGEGRLLRLARGGSAGAVTDLVLHNPGRQEAIAEVELLDGAGAPLLRRNYALAPLELANHEDAFADAGAGELAHAQAIVRVASGGDTVHAWAVVRHARTGEFAVVEPAAPSDEPFVLAPVDASPRLRGGSWRTDLHLVAAGGEPAAVSLVLLTPAGHTAAGREVELAVPEGGLALDDVLAALFSYRGAGALLVTPRRGALAAAAGVALARGTTRVGHAVAPVPLSRAVGQGGECRLFPIVRGNIGGGPRTHIGLVNPGEGETAFEVTIFDRGGRARRRLTGRLAGRELRQLPDVLQGLSMLGGQSCFAVVRTATSGGRLIAYGTVVEGMTGDPRHVPCV